MLKPESILGKPLVVYIDGDRRQIGTITRAAIRDGSLYIGAEIDLRIPSDSESEDSSE